MSSNRRDKKLRAGSTLNEDVLITSLADFEPLSNDWSENTAVAYAYTNSNRQSRRIAKMRQRQYEVCKGQLSTVKNADNEVMVVKLNYRNPPRIKRAARKSSESFIKRTMSMSSSKSSQIASDRRATRTSASPPPVTSDYSLKRTTRSFSSPPPETKKARTTKYTNSLQKSHDIGQQIEVTPKKQSTKKPRQSSSTKNILSSSEEVACIDAPEDFLKGLGWKRREFSRKFGKTSGRTDKYWYSPITQKKLRSIKEVQRFLAALETTQGDEEEAWKMLKG